MGLAAEKLNFTAADFLIWDETQSLRHEYFHGEVFAMAGGSDNHATVILNVATAIRHHLKGTPCRVFMQDVKLQIENANCYFYPDVFVTCSERDAQQRLIKSEAKLVVEVLSPSSTAFDRGYKFEAYRSLPTLQEYVLIDPEAQTAEVYRRSANEEWILRAFAVGQALMLHCVDLTISAAVVFADVENGGVAAVTA
jgi:Uma2 family endonuclease